VLESAVHEAEQAEEHNKHNTGKNDFFILTDLGTDLSTYLSHEDSQARADKDIAMILS
jgi:hypothetical protein